MATYKKPSTVGKMIAKTKPSNSGNKVATEKGKVIYNPALPKSGIVATEKGKVVYNPVLPKSGTVATSANPVKSTTTAPTNPVIKYPIGQKPTPKPTNPIIKLPIGKKPAYKPTLVKKKK